MSYITNNSGEGSSVKSERNLAEDASEYANQSRSSNHDNVGKGSLDPKKLLDDKVKEMHSSSSIYDEEVRAYNRTDPRQEEEFNREEYLFEFYVDSYSDDKIKEIISIFRNDFKPPKNLWIENMNIQANSDVNYFNDVFADDDNYNDTEENHNDPATHNQEIDDIGYNISEIEKLKTSTKPAKSKSDKPNTEEQKSKPKEKESPKPQIPKDSEVMYNDRIKKKDESSDDEVEPKKDEPEPPKPKPEKKIEKTKIDNSTKPDAKDLKISKAKDGLNIEVNDSGISDISRNAVKHKQNNSGKAPNSKRSHKSNKDGKQK